MISKAKLTLIAAIAASSIALPAAALAQSAYTTGSAASRAAARLPVSIWIRKRPLRLRPGPFYDHAAQGR